MPFKPLLTTEFELGYVRTLTQIKNRGSQLVRDGNPISPNPTIPSANVMQITAG